MYSNFFSPSSSHTILAFPYQTAWRYSDGNPPNGGAECRWGRQKSRFWAYISLHRVLSTLRPASVINTRRRTTVAQVVTLIAVFFYLTDNVVFSFAHKTVSRKWLMSSTTSWTRIMSVCNDFGTLITQTIGHRQVFLLSHLTYLVHLLYFGMSRPKYNDCWFSQCYKTRILNAKLSLY